MIRRLTALADPAYRAFQAKLLPNIPPERILGVRLPALRQLARELEAGGEAAAFMQQLPHTCYDADMLHALLICREKDFDRAVAAVDALLPYVDNWAVCDSLRPRIFGKNRDALLPHIRRWLASDRPYTVRFGMEMLLCHYLEDAFSPDYLQWAAAAVQEDYYVRMMAAWYFATALAKQYAAALPYLQERRLPVWIHNKTIQKAVESRRIDPAQKQYLRTLKIR